MREVEQMIKKYATISEYINLKPKKIRDNLELIRMTIKKSAPQAVEAIKYGMPTFRFRDKNIIHFANFNTHYGLYPGALAIVVFKRDLSQYDCSKGAIRFPLDKRPPIALISRIVKYNLKSVLTKEKKR